ncbi:NADP-dependent oxidoreductase [Suttonella ornithocola]|uniref:NADPH-dependent curcumin reductase n=1 Tax=Suttonella ornithocola TaxID=279832 RepID=A0A380N0J4_9GAMM|nr:NADP-dependent oxidoreductase [Suttonella ornithocola]SUO97796.1 NADPH-dependent curcumin reductase [Suttonella ornithocola]
MSVQTIDKNRQWLLHSRPKGRPTLENFKQVETDIPKPQSGQILLRTVYLSLDPYMRGRMSNAESYADPVALGDVMVGGSVCRVMKSEHPDYAVGDWVVSYGGWQDYHLSNGQSVVKLPEDMVYPSYGIGVLGMPGFTAYMGLLDIGRPQEGETVVVAAATGAVGSVVGQVAKIKGARAVGIAGGMEKCRYAVETLGFDVCIDHQAEDFAEQLRAACPQGIDVYYENVGGKVFDAVLPLLNTKARIPLCGLISQYNAESLPEGSDRLPLLMGTILRKRMTVRGFIIFDDYGAQYPQFIQQMTQWLQEGKIRYREHRIDGLDQAPQGLIDLLDGKNFGKVIVQVGEEKNPN